MDPTQRPPTPTAAPAAPSTGRAAGFEAAPPPPGAYRSQAGSGRCFTCGAAVGQVHDDDCPHRARGPVPTAPSTPDAGTFEDFWGSVLVADLLPDVHTHWTEAVKRAAELAWRAAERQHTAALAERDAEVERLRDALGTLASYIYASFNPGEIPSMVRQAMRLAEQRAAAPQPPQEPAR